MNVVNINLIKPQVSQYERGLDPSTPATCTSLINL